MGKGSQYIQLVKVLYCKLPTIGNHLPTLPMGSGCELHTLEFGGKCVTIAPPLPFPLVSTIDLLVERIIPLPVQNILIILHKNTCHCIFGFQNKNGPHGLCWNALYINTCISFGSRHGSGIFQCFSDVVYYVLRS